MRSTKKVITVPPKFRANTWTMQTGVDGGWNGICYGHAGFVVCGTLTSPNLFGTSVDGTSWTLRSTSDPSLNFTSASVRYGNGVYICVAGSGTSSTINYFIRRSVDGVTWSLVDAVTNNALSDCCYGSNLNRWVAVARAGTGNRVITSDDNGLTWTVQSSAADNSWRGVCYAEGVYVAVSDTGTGNRVMTSPDGEVWTSRTSAADNSWRRVCYGNGRLVAVAITGTGNRVMTSDDKGVTWVTRTSAADNDWRDVCYANGLFVAVAITGTGNRVMTSPDGITWATKTSANDYTWSGVAFGAGVFAACTGQVSLGTARIMTSNVYAA